MSVNSGTYKKRAQLGSMHEHLQSQFSYGKMKGGDRRLNQNFLRLARLKYIEQWYRGMCRVMVCV